MAGLASPLCRQCGARLMGADGRCAACGSPRIVRHPELDRLGLAHVDCDAFFAAVEKRRDPSLAARPVIVGGRKRGVVAACCYVARLYGVRSAMPMFKALALCPDAVVMPPDMAAYREAGLAIRAMMVALTPAVEPLSIDEAFLDLDDPDAQLGRDSPAAALAGLQRRIEAELGLTVSIGLSHNKMLAKLASDLDKPRGFAVIGRAETAAFLAPLNVGRLWGVGPALRSRLNEMGITTVGELAARPEDALIARFGLFGRKLARMARGIDERKVKAERPTRSVSAETTFRQDLSRLAELEPELAEQCRQLARRLDRAGLAASGVTLKLRDSQFRVLGRSRRLVQPTRRWERLFAAARLLLAEVIDGRPWRLIGVKAEGLTSAAHADPPGLFDAPQPVPATPP